MAQFELQALSPRRVYVGKNPAGEKQFVEFTPAHAKSYVDSANKMLAAGLHVPVIWEHRDDGKPRKLKLDEWNTERTKGVAGHVVGLRADETGKAFVRVEIPDTADQRQAEKVRFCSPEIDRFIDADGKDWGEVFTHIALTPRPVQHDQPPIKRLSFGLPIRLSQDPETGEDMEEAPEVESEVDETDEDETNDKLSGGDVKAIANALRKCGMNIPESVSDAKELMIAIEASQGGQNTGEPEVVESSQVGSTGMALSLAKLTKHAESMARANAKADLHSLLSSGRITRHIFATLSAKLTKVRLSFDGKTGDLIPNEVTAAIAAYQLLPASHAAGAKSPRGVRLSSEDVTEVELPIGDDGSGLDDKAAIAAWDKAYS